MLVLTVIFCAIALLGDQCSAVPYKTGENKPKNICDYIYTQFEINFEEITGTWYVVQTLVHQKHVFYGEKLDGANIELHISHSPEQNTVESSHHLTLKWVETVEKNDTTAKYEYDALESVPGHWKPSSPRRGIPYNPHLYQLSGDIFISRASEHSLILTFCKDGSFGKLFSVVLVKSGNRLPDQAFSEFQQTLERRGLPIELLINAATIKQLSFGVMIFTVLSSFVWNNIEHSIY